MRIEDCTKAQRVTATEPHENSMGDWILPGETLYVLDVGTGTVRVRCPASGADMWVSPVVLEPLDEVQPPVTAQTLNEVVAWAKDHGVSVRHRLVKTKDLEPGMVVADPARDLDGPWEVVSTMPVNGHPGDPRTQQVILRLAGDLTGPPNEASRWYSPNQHLRVLV